MDKKKKTIFRHPGTPLSGKTGMEDNLLVKSTLDGSIDTNQVDEMLGKVETDLTEDALKKELKEAKISKKK